MVVGSDRVDEFDRILNEYNGVEGKRHGYYGFDNIEVISAGERDPDAEGIEGMSASKMRDAAEKSDFDSFKTGIPNTMSDADKKKMYLDVRKGQGIREEREMGNDYDSLRDAYLTGKIWNVGETVEAKGLSGEVVRKGTNYLSFMTEDGKVHKAWLHEIELNERNYAKEYANYQGKPEQIARRSSRNKARRAMGNKAVKGMDVGHRDNDPMNNDPTNLRNEDPSKNRREPRLREGADEIKQLEKMLKDLEKKKKKTPGDGFAKMRIKELIADLKSKKEEVELDEDASVYKKTARKNKNDVTYAFGRTKKLDGQPKEKGGYWVWKLSQNYDGKVKGGIRNSWSYVAKDLSYSDAVKLMNKKLGRKEFKEEVELDELSSPIPWLNKAVAKISQVRHPKGWEKIAKEYVDGMKDPEHRKHPSAWAAEIAQRYRGVESRDLIKYINNLVKKGKLPKELEAELTIEAKSPLDRLKSFDKSRTAVGKKPIFKDKGDNKVVRMKKKGQMTIMNVPSDEVERYKKKGYVAVEQFSFKDFVQQIQEVKQDTDIKDKEGTQPAKYHQGLSPSTKKKRDAHFKAKKAGPAPGDADAETKPSVHTQKYKKMFGEVLPDNASQQDYIDDFIKSDAPQFKGKDKKKRIDMAVAAYNQRNEEIELHEKNEGLINKSEKSGISYSILKKVYDRGLAAYKTSHRPQWAMARVNSFITKGKGTWGKADSDLAKQVEMLESLNDMKYPKVESKPLKNITGDINEVNVPTPPKNDSRETKNELETVKKLSESRSKEDEKSVKKHDDDPTFAIKKYMNENDLEYDKKDIKKIMESGLGVSRHFKNSFQRPRPWQVAENMDMNLVHMGFPSDSMETPSYPSGHSLQSRLVAEKYAEKYPDHKKGLIAAANECGLGRVKAGWHYPSDHKSGVLIAKQVAPMVEVEIDEACWDGYKQVGMKKKGGKEVPNCVPEEFELNEWGEIEEESEYQGRKVTLNKPTKGDIKKSKVYVRNEKGNVVKVEFGDPDMQIQKDIPARRKSFRARHNCDNPGPKWKARYWSCKAW